MFTQTQTQTQTLEVSITNKESATPISRSEQTIQDLYKMLIDSDEETRDQCLTIEEPEQEEGLESHSCTLSTPHSHNYFNYIIHVYVSKYFILNLFRFFFSIMCCCFLFFFFLWLS